MTRRSSDPGEMLLEATENESAHSIAKPAADGPAEAIKILTVIGRTCHENAI
jgi:hypothetical protein